MATEKLTGYSAAPSRKAHDAAQGESLSSRLIRAIPIMVLIIVAIFLVFGVPNFFTQRNITNVLVQAAPLAIMAIGMTFVMITGGIDLSIPSMMAFSAIMGNIAVRDLGVHWLVGCVVMLIAALLLGLINGYAVAYLRMIPFVVTLAMMTVVTGASIWITNSVSLAAMPEEFFDIVLYRLELIDGIPIPVIIPFTIVLAIIAVVVIRGSIFGRWLYAVGTNVKAARVSGIPTQRVIFSTYLISGLCAGIAAIILAARLGSASANMGTDGVVLDIVSSVVVGGVSIYGGVGGPLGAVLGALIIQIIGNSLNMLQVSYFTTLIIKGFVIIAFVAFDSLRRRQGGA
jgi:ribose transport system permease protein